MHPLYDSQQSAAFPIRVENIAAMQQGSLAANHPAMQNGHGSNSMINSVYPSLPEASPNATPPIGMSNIAPAPSANPYQGATNCYVPHQTRTRRPQSALQFGFNSSTSTTRSHLTLHPSAYAASTHNYSPFLNGQSTSGITVQFPSPMFTSPPAFSNGVYPHWQNGIPLQTTWAQTVQPDISFGDTASSSGVHHFGDNSKGMSTKRKCSQETEPSNYHSQKVFISEEKMAARLQDLRLDNNNTDWHPDFEDSWLRKDRTLKEIEESLELEADSDYEDCETDPVVELSEEVKKSIEAENILQQVVREELRKPNLQVILWKPPPDFTKKQLVEAEKCKLEQLSGDGMDDMIDVDIETKSDDNTRLQNEQEPIPSTSGLGRVCPLEDDHMDL